MDSSEIQSKGDGSTSNVHIEELAHQLRGTIGIIRMIAQTRHVDSEAGGLLENVANRLAGISKSMEQTHIKSHQSDLTKLAAEITP